MMTITQREFVEMIRDGSWFRFHLGLLRHMECQEAVMLSFILNQLGLYWDKMDEEGWFTMSRGIVEHFLCLDRNRQQDSLNFLVDKKLIKTRQGGRLRQRQIKVNVLRVFELMKSTRLETESRDVTGIPVTRRLETESRATGKPGVKKKEKENTVALARSGSGLLGPDEDFEKKVIQKLHSAILQELKINKSTKGWRETIVQMQRFDRISQKRIKHAVIWFSKHIGEMFVPHIEDARDFRRKFAALEKRMADDKPTKAEHVEVPAEIKSVLKDLRDDLHWPKGSRAQLTEVVVKSWKNLQEFSKKVYELGQKGEGLVESFAAGQIEMRGYGKRYLRTWFERYNKRLGEWSDWSGSLAMTIWSIDHKDFVKELEDDAAEFGPTQPERYVNAIRNLFK